MNMKKLTFPIFLSIILVGVAHAVPVIDSREYKILLKPELFTDNVEQAKNQSDKFLADVNNELKKQGIIATIDKTFEEDKIREISFYDTPGTCVLKYENYVARERINRKNNKRELMIKFRTDDINKLDGIAFKGRHPKSSSKTEADVSPGNIVYSVSTKQTIRTEKIDSIDVIEKLFPGLNKNFKQDGILAKVSGLSVIDYSYEGPELILDEEPFNFELSIWYVNDETKPAIVELSYTIKESAGNFSPKTLKNAEFIMNMIAGMEQWAASSSMMKTAWVYQYQPDFCK